MKRHPERPIKGRGASSNPDNRYAAERREEFDDGWEGDGEVEGLQVELIRDTCRRIISRNSSPDVPHQQSINPYRGCEHGCIYCFARPTHAYWGHSPGLEFETRLHYKPDAPALLRRELAARSYRCNSPIALGINTDAYQPVERRLRISRSVLEVLAECRHPVSIVTKSALIERDLELLQQLAADNLVEVFISITTLDKELARRMEPRAATPQRRLATLERLSAAGIPTGVLMAPLIPFLNDQEIEPLLQRVREAGARSAGYIFLRLPLELEGLFSEWLSLHYPQRAERVLNRIRDSRGGKGYDSRFGSRMRGEGLFADLLANRFNQALKRLDFPGLGPLNCDRFCPPAPNPGQLDLFGSAPHTPE